MTEVEERRNGGAVRDERSPLKLAMAWKEVSHDLASLGGAINGISDLDEREPSILLCDIWLGLLARRS